MTQAAPPAPPTSKPAGGLEGVVAAKSDICFIDGQAGRLVYRGYEIGDLVENVTFEECAYLLWEGSLPNRQQLGTLKSQIAASGVLPRHVSSIIAALPPKHCRWTPYGRPSARSAQSIRIWPAMNPMRIGEKRFG